MDTKSADIIFVAGLVSVILLILVLLLFNLLLTGRNRRLRHKAEKLAFQAELEKELTRVKLEVAESTLTDVARDLHDDVGQLLSFSIIQMNAAKNRSAVEQSDMYEEVRTTIQNALNSIRGISKVLSHDYISSFGLQEALQRLFENATRQTGIVAELNYPGRILFNTANNEILSFRIIQECMNNSLKHANAGTIRLSVVEQNGEVSLTFDDDGKGLTPGQLNSEELKNSLGFTNMRKRAEMMSGQLQVLPAPNRGTRIILSFPNN